MKITLLAVALCCGVAHADPYETYEQFERKFGKPVQHDNDWTEYRVYEWEGFRIRVEFLLGTSREETFQRLDGAPMTLADIEKFLPYPVWRRGPRSDRFWSRVDHKAYAWYWPHEGTLQTYLTPRSAHREPP